MSGNSSTESKNKHPDGLLSGKQGLGGKDGGEKINNGQNPAAGGESRGSTRRISGLQPPPRPGQKTAAEVAYSIPRIPKPIIRSGTHYRGLWKAGTRLTVRQIKTLPAFFDTAGRRWVYYKDDPDIQFISRRGKWVRCYWSRGLTKNKTKPTAPNEMGSIVNFENGQRRRIVASAVVGWSKNGRFLLERV
ncbi:hypothetical protein OAU26_03795 [Mariniblastus sp.]|nr:hypothetical protein [Mariniblastus sp.]